MIKCRACETELPSTARFCGICGIPQDTGVSSRIVPIGERQAVAPMPLLTDQHSPADRVPQGTYTIAPPLVTSTQRTLSHSQQTAELLLHTPAEIAPSPLCIVPPVGPLADERLDTSRTPPIADPLETSGFTFDPRFQPGYAALSPLKTPAPPAGNDRDTEDQTSRWIVILITAIVIIGGSGAGAAVYVLTRPHPVISISSSYHVGALPAGSTNTMLHFTGQHFSGNSAITFLLDDTPAPGAPSALSDQNGNVSVDLPITLAWTPGEHLLTARDASNYISQTGVLLDIVAQGAANTPGPLGAPPDDSGFMLTLSSQGQYNQGLGPFTNNEVLIVIGHPDPTGGSVCQAANNGRIQHYGNLMTSNGTSFDEDIATTCTGTYKSGKITYAETITSDTITLHNNGNQAVCILQNAHTIEELSGNFVVGGNFSGQISFDSIPPQDFSCPANSSSYAYFSYVGGSGTWSGTFTLA